MDTFSFVFFSVYGMILLVGFIILVYLIIRRINIRDQETFEKRDN